MTFFGNNNVFFLQRHARWGETLVVPCTMSILGPEHLEKSIELHNTIAKALEGDIFIPSDEEDISLFHLTDKGLALGVWNGDKLICVRTVKTDGDWVNKCLADIGVPEDPAHTTALTDYTIVDKEFRGNNVQFLSYYASEILLSRNKNRIVTTVAPKNVFSLQNILRCGYHIFGLRPLYGGFLRFVTEKRLRGARRIWTNWHHTVGLRNIEEQMRLIEDGNVGYKLIHKNTGGFSMLYAPLGDEPPQNLARMYKRRPMAKTQ